MKQKVLNLQPQLQNVHVRGHVFMVCKNMEDDLIFMY